MNNDAKHIKTKKKLKIIGLIVLIIGLCCTVAGFVNFGISIAKGEMPKLFFLLIIGLPCAGIGGMLTAAGFRKEIMTYTAKESAPAVNIMGQSVAPGISAISAAAKAADPSPVICPECGENNEAGSNFCKKGGKQLVKKCPDCGNIVGSGSGFCSNCGKKLD